MYRVLQYNAKYWALLGYTGGEEVRGGTVATTGYWRYSGVLEVLWGTAGYWGYWGVIGGPGGYSMVLQVQWGTVGY